MEQRNRKQVNDEPTKGEQMSMDLVQTTRNASVGSLQQAEAEGMWFPRGKLLQGLSPEVTNGDGRPGQWHIEGHGAVPSIVLVPLGERLSRRLTEGQGDEMLTLCYSDDGREGKGDPGGNCLVCLMNEWTTDEETGRRQPPVCVLTRSVFGYAPAIQLPLRVDFKRTAEKAARQIKTFTTMHGQGRVAVELGSAQKKGTYAYYIPTVRIVQVDPEALAMAQQLMGRPTQPNGSAAPPDDETPF